jgi:hypothetical protein
MGLDKPERKPAEPSKANDLSGNESAQRKRFIRSEEEDSGNQQAAWSSDQSADESIHLRDPSTVLPLGRAVFLV